MNIKPHKYGHWKYLVVNGWKKKEIANPPRHRLLVRAALTRMNCAYKEVVGFLNPHYHGRSHNMEVAMQWLDFLVYDRRRKKFGAIIFHPYSGKGGVMPNEREALAAKEKFLQEKNMRYVVLSKHEGSSQVYQVLINRMFIPN